MSEEDAIDEIIQSQNLCESLTVRYTADLVAFDDSNGTSMALQFSRDVWEEVRNEEYRRAITGLDNFVADFLRDDPLMRIAFGGLISVLRPVLSVLVNAQQSGLDAGG